VGYSDGDAKGSNFEVRAYLYRLNTLNGYVEFIRRLDSDNYDADGPTNECVKFTHTFDFDHYVYWVTLKLTRNSTSGNPQVWSVQLSHGCLV
jgi:hypothetical protein